MQTSPTFIGGLDRSGKTTLRAYLHSHPNIAIPAVGSNMWTYFYNQYGDLKYPENFERCLAEMLKYKHVAFLEPDVDRVRQEFWQGPPTYAHLFSLFLIHFALRENKPRWGVQTGLIERYADQVISSYPGAKIIHMLRDPRDRYAGSLELWPKGRMRAGGAVSRWLYSTKLAERNLQKYPDSYLVIRFEDMIRKTETTIENTCNFLGEQYYSDMLSMPGAVEHRDKLIRRSKKNPGESPLSEEYIGVYRKFVPENEVTYIQLFLRRLMKKYRYDLEIYQPSLRRITQFLLVTLPKNFIRMILWAFREFLEQNFPNHFGRNPGVNMIAKSNTDPQKV